jgi:hypothetical protein
MTPRRRYTFFIDPDQRAALAAIKVRDGISESEQIRRAVTAWIASKGITAGRKRAVTRQRP